MGCQIPYADWRILMQSSRPAKGDIEVYMRSVYARQFPTGSWLTPHIYAGRLHGQRAPAGVINPVGPVDVRPSSDAAARSRTRLPEDVVAVTSTVTVDPSG